ncbi:MAG: 3-isopropylmalate dehydratase small subunit [Thermoanaerobacterales bacterium]|jgi:3-isopropylmalate/(R)-2-methylmalate dehydratase small subunit|nr:3-isopropylmalate dehydratase small subunit [Thermoanaerobacterales bacterium]
MIYKGKAWKFGDNVDTDVIIPARHLNIRDVNELASHCMEEIDPQFTKKISTGDIIVAGKNFGCGSSREHAPLVIKTAGISCVIACSFARIFYRNAINLGLPILECPNIVTDVRQGDNIYVDTSQGFIKNLTNGKTYKAYPFPDFIREIIDAGGLIKYAKKGGVCDA